MMTLIKIDLEIIFSILNIAFALGLLLTAIYAQKRFGLAIYKRPWYLFMLVSILMVIGSAVRIYLSLYDLYDMLWIPRALDFVERVLLITGIYMLASIAVKLWGYR